MKITNLKWCLLVLPLLLLSCGGDGDWSKALLETSPPNPRDALVKRAEVQEDNSGESAVTKGSENEAGNSSASNEQKPSNSQRRPEAGKATLNIILLNYPDCYKGAVRLFVDGQIVGLFDNQGKLTVNVEPGKRHLDIWDSGGRWTIDVTAPAGASMNIEVACGDRKNYEQA